MIGLEYRLVQPDGEPIPFAPWFARAPQGRVFALDLEMSESGGSCFVLLEPGGAVLDEFLEDVMSFPTPNATVWRPATIRGCTAVEARWKEPIYAGLFSPMAIAARSLGPSTICSYTIEPREIRHRVALSATRSFDELWPTLSAAVNQYCGLSAVNVRLELLRLRRLVPAAVTGDAAHMQRRLFEFGGFDLTDVAAAARTCEFLGAEPREMAALLA